jgi:hypothetical protein
MKKLALLMSCVPLLEAAPARACDTEATAKPDSECVVMARAGVRGVWFQLHIAEQLRTGALELPELRSQLGAYEQALGVRDFQLENLRQAVAAQREASKAALGANEILVRDAQRARSERDEALQSRSAWYRSPVFWFGVGVGTTLISGYVLARAL